MDVIGSHAARLPAIDARWEPGPWERDELLRALVDGGMAGPRVSHPMDNVRDNIRLLCEGDEDKQFGMTGLQTHTPEQVFSDRKSTRLNSSHIPLSRMPSSA